MPDDKTPSEPDTLYVDFIGDVATLVPPSKHGWCVGIVRDRAVVVVSPTTVQPRTSPPSTRVRAALAIARSA